MEKSPDVHLKAILSSPIRNTPNVPVPDWSPQVCFYLNV